MSNENAASKDLIKANGTEGGEQERAKRQRRLIASKSTRTSPTPSMANAVRQERLRWRLGCLLDALPKAGIVGKWNPQRLSASLLAAGKRALKQADEALTEGRQWTRRFVEVERLAPAASFQGGAWWSRFPAGIVEPDRPYGLLLSLASPKACHCLLGGESATPPYSNGWLGACLERQPCLKWTRRLPSFQATRWAKRTRQTWLEVNGLRLCRTAVAHRPCPRFAFPMALCEVRDSGACRTAAVQATALRLQRQIPLSTCTVRVRYLAKACP